MNYRRSISVAVCTGIAASAALVAVGTGIAASAALVAVGTGIAASAALVAVMAPPAAAESTCTTWKSSNGGTAYGKRTGGTTRFSKGETSHAVCGSHR